MATFDRSGFGKQERARNCVAQSYLIRRGPLPAFLADPAAAKESGALPLAPPSRPRLSGDGR
jgi:hypothetical protein